VLGFSLPHELNILCVAAHPDDVEIGCGGTLLALGKTHALSVTTVLMTASPARALEARAAVDRFTPGATLRQLDLPDGRLPAHWDAVKQSLEDLAGDVRPDLVFTHRVDDAHQDHRTVAGLVTTVWRDALVLRFEIPKWDGDLGRPTHYVPLSPEVARQKVDHLNGAYPSQHGRDWWDDELFLGFMRVRGMECRSPYAEAFHVEKAVLTL
jgi:LmbE family N-acetylglucosaminyl deacetylase